MRTYQWVAQYTDGTTINQRDSDQTPHSFEDIDRDKLQTFTLKNENGVVAISIIFEGDGKELVWTRRTFMPNVGSPYEVHIVGKKGRFISGLFPDGSIAVRNNFVDDGVFDEVFSV